MNSKCYEKLTGALPECGRGQSATMVKGQISSQHRKGTWVFTIVPGTKKVFWGVARNSSGTHTGGVPAAVARFIKVKAHSQRGRESGQAPRATALGPQGRAPFILLGCEKSGFILNYLIPESRGLFLNYPVLSSDFLWAVFYHFGSYPKFSRFAHKVGGQNS